MSFDDLLQKISPTLKRITKKLDGRFSSFDDDDLFQEAAIHLWLQQKNGELNNKTDSYILQNCYYYLKNYLRKTIDKFELISLDALDNEPGKESDEIIDLGDVKK